MQHPKTYSGWKSPLAKAHCPSEDSLLPNQVCPKHRKPNAEMLRFAAEKRFIHKVNKQGDGRASLKSAFLKARGSGYLRDKEAAWSEVWGKMTAVKKRWSDWCSVQAYLSYVLLHGMPVQKMAALAWSEGGVFGPLTSKDHPLDTWADPDEWLAVLSCLIWARVAPCSWKTT